MSTLDKILKARSALVLDHPFFGVLSLRLSLVEDNSFPTLATDGKGIYYNSKYIDSLSTREMIGVLAHEVMHLSLGHSWRQGTRDPMIWNIASDYAINQNLISTGFCLPEGALIDSRYDAFSSEGIYAQIASQTNKKEDKTKQQDKNKQQSKQQDNKKEDCKTDPGMCGIILPTKNKQEEKELKAEWQAATVQAAQLAKGTLPANIKRQIQEILNPTIPWYILLRDFVEKTARNDYNWMRPSRRYIGQGIVLPSLISEELPETIIAIDTSGSIDKKALSTFAAEASNVLSAYDTTIKIIYCNNRIQKEETFTRADFPMKLKPVGGGGTDFRPVFDHIEKQNLTPSCLIYFTDMHGRFPKQEPNYPTMWLTTTKDKKAPFGATVQFSN